MEGGVKVLCAVLLLRESVNRVDLCAHKLTRATRSKSIREIKNHVTKTKKILHPSNINRQAIERQSRKFRRSMWHCLCAHDGRFFCRRNGEKE
jgi:hypothetical protein